MKTQRDLKKPFLTEVQVLCVDDDYNSLKLAKTFLEKEDERLKIDTSSTCLEALNKLKIKNYEAIVCDYQMPNMDGLRFLEILRSENNLIPFIILTGKSREEVAIKALNLGADRYLQKGGDPKTQYGILAQAIIQEVNHKRSERFLLESEEKYRNLVERANDGIAIIQNDLVKYGNKSLSNIIGYSVDELIDTQYINYLHEDEHFKIQQRIEQVYKSNAPQITETLMIDKEGNIKDVEINASLIPFENKPATLIFVHDITKQKETEKERIFAIKALEETKNKYQILVEHLKEGLTFEDPEGIITFVNSRTINLLGYKEEELIGKHWSFIVPEKDLEQSYLETAKRSKRISSTYESSLLAKDGTTIPVIVSASPIFSDTGKYQGVIVLSTEISELKKTEKALKISKDRENLLFTLLRHDLKNKIFVIHGYLSLLNLPNCMEKDNEYIKRAMTTIEECQQLLEKVGKLRDIDQEEEVKIVYLHDLLMNAIEKNRIIAIDKSVSIEYKGSTASIKGGTLLEELFSNIIENSLKHASCKKIQIKTHEKEQKILVIFEDDGKGVPQIINQKHFLTKNRTNEYASTGIGLLLVSRIAEMYGGSVNFKTSDLGGLRIDIELNKA